MKEQITQINLALAQIISHLDQIISQPYVDTDIQYGDKHYHFRQPLNKSDKVDLAYQRQEFINALLSDTLVGLTRALSASVIGCSTEYCEDHHWERIMAFEQGVTSAEQVQSPIAPDSYEEVKADAQENLKSKALDPESYYVKVDTGQPITEIAGLKAEDVQ